MPIFDLTNQNISDTFQNVLQKTGSGGQLYDLQGNQITNLTIAGTLHAQTYAITSSVTSMSVAFASGSTQFGDSSDDTHIFSGSVLITGSNSSIGKTLTVDGDISASGDLYITEDSRIYMDADLDTYIRTQADDQIDFFANGKIKMMLTGAGANDGGIMFGSIGDDVNFSFNTSIDSGTSHNETHTLWIDGGTGNVGIGGGTWNVYTGKEPPKTLTVEGDISASGDLYLNADNISPWAPTPGTGNIKLGNAKAIFWSSGSDDGYPKNDISLYGSGGGLSIYSGSTPIHILHKSSTGNEIQK